MSTPMFQQYHALKAAAPDCLLLFRMGDFYETFFDDAVVVARVAELALTSRNKNDPDPVPMAGVPHHAAAGYIQKLTDAGYRVAIADQMEDPAQAKGLVRREIVRVVTPGVTLDPGLLGARQSNWLAAVARPSGRRGEVGLAVLDVSTGDLRATTLDDAEAAAVELSRFEPREVLLSPGADAEPALVEAAERARAVRTAVPDESWDVDEARAELCALLGAADLAGFGLRRDEPAVRAAGAVVRYARRSLGGAPANVVSLRTWRPGAHLALDETTRRNLELFRGLRGGDKNASLFALLDEAATPMGSRLLREWLGAPLLGMAPIVARQDAVAALIEDGPARSALRRALSHVADLERIAARMALKTAHARDLVALRRSLHALPDAVAEVAGLRGLDAWVPGDRCEDVAEELERWLVDDPPLQVTEGGLIRPGVDANLDEILALALDGRGVVARLEQRERDATQIGSLKIRPHGTWGLVFEITRAQADKAPKHYIPKQELAGICRFVTAELLELQERVAGADARRRALEHQLFTALRERVQAQRARLLTLAAQLAALDALSALAEVAERWGWVRPTLVEAPVLDVVGGRHPVVQARVEAAGDGQRFVPNDLRLDARDEPGARRMSVVTGPNMAGKSTILRQTALLVILAQMGAWVPAERATLGLCDRVFTRVGASDDLAQGQSTFMVEMAETAAILHHATASSLVLLDEIGRGTSTYDGLSIAWAVAEDLVDRVGCRAMFATHYHELCELADTRPAVKNQSVAVSEQGEQIHFLRQLREGGASRSYGIQCARLAGLPGPVVTRARSLLRHFEKHAPRNDRQQLSLFGAAPPPDDAPAEPVDDGRYGPLLDAIDAIDPDALSPREALDALYRLQAARRAIGGAGAG